MKTKLLYSKMKDSKDKTFFMQLDFWRENRFTIIPTIIISQESIKVQIFFWELTYQKRLLPNDNDGGNSRS